MRLLNVRQVVVHTFAVAANERRENVTALKASPHPDAQNLAEDIQKHVDKGRKEIQRRFQTQHNVIYRDDDS